MKIEWMIKTKLFVLGLYCAAMMVGIGVSSYWALTRIDRQMNKIALNAKAIRDHMEADMMHDAIRGDVLNAFVQGEKKDSWKKKTVLDDLAKHAEQLRAGLSEVSRNVMGAEIDEALNETYPALDAYVRDAERVAALAFENPSAALTQFDAFIQEFGLLEKKMEHLSNLIEKEAEGSQAFGDEAVTSSKNTIFSITVITLLVLGVVLFAIATPIIRRLEELTRAAAMVAGGDLTIRSDATRKDEIGQLSKEFNIMTQNLFALVSQLKENAVQISSASKELSASSGQMSANSAETESQAKTVSSVSQSTNLSIQTVSSASEELSITIKEISKSLQEATLITREAVKMAESTNGTISKLGDSSMEIGNVIKVINSIARQTNLLALNATIEAARAGEAGKGFAVVANEVKELAKATAKATEEINQKITTIQGDTLGAVSGIGEIGDIIKKINDISTNIAGAVEEQAATTNEISRSVAEVSRGTREVSNSITEAANASRSTAEVAARVMAASQALSDMGTDLLSLVNRFHVSTGDPLEVSVEGGPERTQKTVPAFSVP